MSQRVNKYDKVNNDIEEPEHDDNDAIANDQYPILCVMLVNWMKSQTQPSSLILYSYLFWYLFIMFSFGIKNMSMNAWGNAAVLATFVCVALNAAAYHGPLCGQHGYTNNYFKILRFWCIPFCVSSISVACNASPTDCMYLFPTNLTFLAIQISVIVVIISIGSFQYFYVLPKLRSNKKKNRERTV
eukprot:368808_1